jgi:hypothetical protein
MKIVNPFVEVVCTVSIICDADMVPARDEGGFAVRGIFCRERLSGLAVAQESEENRFARREARRIRHVVENFCL